MEKITNFFKKYKLVIISILMVFFMFKSCNKSSNINKLEDDNIALSEKNDSLNSVIKYQKNKIDSLPEIIRINKLSIYLELNKEISEMDRTPQMMEFHKGINAKIFKLQK